MIHKWRQAKRNKSVRNRNLTSNNYQAFGDFEQLEEKRCLAFLGFFDGITLDIIQTADDGDALVENSTGVWRTTDNVDTFTFVDATNVTVTMLDGTADKLDFNVDLEHTGNVELFVGNGVRDVVLGGLLNEIGGDLNIVAGDDEQQVQLTSDVGAALIVHGSAEVHLGQDFDIVQSNGALVTIDGDLAMSGVNEYQYSLMVGLPGPPVTGGNVFIDNSIEDVESTMIPGGATILADFTYIGGVNIDTVDLGGSFIGGNADIDLGLGNPFFGVAQSVTIAGTVDLGDITIVAGDSNLGNEINLLGAFNGNIVSYTGGDLVDTVIYSLVGPQADVFAIMGGGDDVFELNVPVNLLEIDFGNDLGDEFINNVAPIDFNFEFDITNFHFFDHFYTFLNDTLVMNQLADTGDIIIDNDGGPSGFDWRMFPAIGGFSSTVGAENLVVNMLSNTGNNVNMDLFNPVIASIEINLGDGARLVEFTGIANNPLRDIKITAGAGDQEVDLSVNSPLGVATLDIDLGAGFDIVEDNANSLIIDEDLKFTGVNHFEHDGLLSVFRDAFIDTTGETQDSLFASNGSFFVGDNFSYTGGDGADELRLNGLGGALISDTALIDIGDSTGVNDQFILLGGPDTRFLQQLTIASSNSNTTDFLVTGPGSSFDADLAIDLAGGPNDVLILGTFGGTNVSYNGGPGVDLVTYGLTGAPANLTINLGLGDDVFNLLAGANIASPLTIDFGGGNDTFNSTYGAFDFDANLLQLDGFNHVYSLGTDTLVSTQTADPGLITIDNNGGSDAIRFINGGTNTLTPVTNLVVNMLDGTSDLIVDLDNAFAGNLGVHLGNGNRTLNLTGTNNSIGGNLHVTAGIGDQVALVSVNTNVNVGGHASIDLGVGNDTLDEGANDIIVAGDLDLLGVNTYENNNKLQVGGNVFVDVSFESNATVFSDGSPIVIAGDFTYLGSDADDQVIFVPTSNVGGNIFIDAGNGNNEAVLVNIFGGTTITYIGGTGTDLVTVGTTGAPAVLNIGLGAGDDTFTLEAGANIVGPLTIDFGLGADTFVNGYGIFDFDAVLSGLSGFDHVYSFGSGSLTSTQVEDLGSVIVDNNGPSQSIRFIVGGTSTLTPVTNLTVNMLDGSTGDLDVNLDNALAGDLEVNLGDGNRALNLGGTDNSVGGHLLVTGGSGGQSVEVAVNNDLTVGGNATFDLGGGNDIVDEDGNNVTILGDLNLFDVNIFEIDGVLDVGASVLVLSSDAINPDSFSTSAASSLFGIFIDMGDGQNDANILGFHGGIQVFYIGGSGVDNVTFGMTGFATDDLDVDLGSGDDTFTLLAGISYPASMIVDFGGGNDTFDNQYGDFDNNTQLLNLNGFNHVFDSLANSLVSTQVADLPGTVIVDNNGAGGAIRFLDGSVSSLVSVTTLFVTMSDSFFTDIAIDFDLLFVGDLTVDLGDATRSLNFTGIDNTIIGDLVIEGGSGDQTVELAKNAALAVSGNASIDLGSDFDIVDEDANGIDILGDFDLVGVNQLVNDGAFSVGGNLTVDNSSDFENSQLTDNAIMDITGDLLYTGSGAGDMVVLNAASSVDGNIDIDAGNGSNAALILGTFGGTDVKYNGGSGADNVTFGTTGNQADVNVKLGGGDDSFVLEAGASISPNSLRVDFGGGDDTFTSNYGQFDFNAQLLDLDGYDAFFDLATGNIDIRQVSDTGDVTIDNNGSSSEIRYGTGTMNTITPANDLRLILQDNTSTNVTADFDNARVGNTVIQLRSGNRNVDFTGSSNTYTGLLRVEASDGVQNVNIAVAADLNVDGTLIVNGRDGGDTVSANNAVNVTGAMLLRGVNTFVNNNGVNVAGDFNMITLLEDENTSLISNTSFSVGGNLTYLGGGGVDAIDFKSTGASIGGFTYADLSSSTDAFNKQRIVLTGGFSTSNLVVDGSSAVAGNVFTTDAATFVTDDVIVNFAPSSSANTATFLGTYNGTYGTYRGGSASDFVTFGATASNMLFAGLTAAGDDLLTIASTADLDFLYFDFGTGNDSLDNQLGDPLPFGNNIFNI